MCPLVPPAFSSDEDCVAYLLKRRAGDPLPENVRTDVDPFCVEPCGSAENTCYLCSKGRNGECSESSMRVTEYGFWREIKRTEISFNGNTSLKNTLEYYKGISSSCVRTGYMMHEYHIKPNLEGVGDMQDYSSLCRIFLQNERNSSLIAQQNLLAQLSDKNETKPVPLLRDPNNQTSHYNNISNNENSYIELNDFLSASELENNIENNSYCDFSNGDYLELNDISTSDDSDSTSSGNSSRMTVNYSDVNYSDVNYSDVNYPDVNYSEEYFNSHELLREIEGNWNPDLLQGMEGGGSVEGLGFSQNGPVQSDLGLSQTESVQSDLRFSQTGPVQYGQMFSVTGPVQTEQRLSVAGPAQTDQRLSVAGPVRTEQVLIRPEPDLVSVPTLHNFIMNEGTMQNEGPSTSRTSRVKRNLSDGTSSSSSNGTSNNNKSNSNSNSNNSRSLQRERKRTVINLGKLGRKLFCFASF